MTDMSPGERDAFKLLEAAVKQNATVDTLTTALRRLGPDRAAAVGAEALHTIAELAAEKAAAEHLDSAR